MIVRNFPTEPHLKTTLPPCFCTACRCFAAAAGINWPLCYFCDEFLFCDAKWWRCKRKIPLVFGSWRVISQKHFFAKLLGSCIVSNCPVIYSGGRTTNERWKRRERWYRVLFFFCRGLMLFIFLPWFSGSRWNFTSFHMKSPLQIHHKFSTYIPLALWHKIWVGGIKRGVWWW